MGTLGKQHFVTITLLAIVMLPGIPAGATGHPDNRQPLLNPISVTPEYSVNVLVDLSNHFGFFNLNIRHQVTVQVLLNLTAPPSTNYTLTISTLLDLTVFPPGAIVRSGAGSNPNEVDIFVPANTTQTTYTMIGFSKADSVLWRDSARIPFVDLDVRSPGVSIGFTYSLVILVPSGDDVLNVFSEQYPNLEFSTGTLAGHQAIVVPQKHPLAPVVVLYQPKNYSLVAVMLTGVVVVSILLTEPLSKHLVRLRRVRTPRIMSELLKRVRLVDSKRLLTAFAACSLLILSLSLAAGPDPRLRVFTMATPNTASQIQQTIASQTPATVLSTSDGLGNLPTMTDVGSLSAIIVADFLPTRAALDDFIHPALTSVPHILIVENLVDPSLAREIRDRYPQLGKIITVSSLDQLMAGINQIPRRTNTFGIALSVKSFSAVEILLALLSLVLVFFGLAAAVCKIVEAGRRDLGGAIAETIVIAIAVFTLTEVVYIASSVSLGLPLGLHAGNPRLTVVGTLGFGGGSRPRALMGLLGILFGAWVALGGGAKLSKIGLVAAGILFLLILLDPVSGGVFLYELTLLFTIGPTFETAFVAWISVRGFFGFLIQSTGGWISPVYQGSTGVVLFYAGIVPLFLLRRILPVTRTVLLAVSSFASSEGFIRVAELYPWKIASNFLPGLAAGLFVSLIFLGASSLEGFARRGLGEGGLV